MIRLTRLNGTALAINSDLIKYVEEAPDTVITLVNGEKLVVHETADEVIDRVRSFRRSVLAGAEVHLIREACTPTAEESFRGQE